MHDWYSYYNTGVGYQGDIHAYGLGGNTAPAYRGIVDEGKEELTNDAKNGNLLALQEYARRFGQTFTAGFENIINSLLNGYGLKITKNGIGYTSLEMLASTPNRDIDPTMLNSPTQGNFKVLWNVISYKDLSSNVWNSPVMRYIVPDMLSLNYSATGAMIVGLGGGLSVNLITRGPHAGIYLTGNISIRVGVQVDRGLSGTRAWFTGNVEDISIDSYLDTGIDLSGAYYIGAAAFVSPNSQGNVSWYGITVGKAGFGASGGWGKTFLIKGWEFNSMFK